MKILLSILACCIIFHEITDASHSVNVASANIDAYIGTETASRLQQEFKFLEETIAVLLSEGAPGKISYIWNPSHSSVVFFSAFPPSGSYHCRFWAYQKTSQGTWLKLGEYDFCTRYGSDLDWERACITLQRDGFCLSFPDSDVEVSHFFSFTKKRDSFYYRMEK